MDSLRSPIASYPPLDLRTISYALAALLGGLVVLQKTIGRSNNDARRLRKPADGHWLWGHEKDAWETPDSAWFLAAASKCGLAYAIKGAFFHRDIIVMADPGGLNHMFTKKTYQYDKGPLIIALVARILGRGLFWANGQTHKQQRQLVTPFFNHPQLRHCSGGIEKLVDRFYDKLCDHVGVKETRLDLIPWFSKISLDVIGLVAFGFDFECGDSDSSQIVINSFEKQVAMGMTLPGFVAPLVLRAFPWITGKLFSFTDAQGEVRTLVKEKVAKVLIERRNNGISDADDLRTDLLDVLMRSTDMEDPDQVSDMLDQINTIIIAGHETVSKTLAMTAWEVARRPELQSALREELGQFKGGKSGRPRYDDFTGTKLPLLDAVVKEALRLYPAVLQTERVAEQDDYIPLRYAVQSSGGQIMSGIHVKKGQVIYVASKLINTNTEIWGSDAQEFDHTRWLEPGRIPPPSQLTAGVNGHFAFFEGPRICAGYRLAMYELKLIFSELIRKFELRESGDRIHVMSSGTMQPFVEGQSHKGAQLPIIIRALEYQL